ncbi:hypothetical protein [Staphylococcus felis]
MLLIFLKESPHQIGIIDPATKYYYQPLWTLVGAGVSQIKDTQKPVSKVISPEAQEKYKKSLE